MGYNQLPSWRDYWSTSNDPEVKMVSEVMSRKRFDDILSFLHINNNTGRPTNLFDYVNRFPELYKITREVSVDESMILFKGCSSIKQYNPMKPIKRGYKLLC